MGGTLIMLVSFPFPEVRPDQGSCAGHTDAEAARADAEASRDWSPTVHRPMAAEIRRQPPRKRKSRLSPTARAERPFYSEGMR